MGSQRPALEALSVAEKAAVLDELLAAQPDLHERGEACATKLMADAERTQIGDEIFRSLHALDIEELNTRAGYQPGRVTYIRSRQPMSFSMSVYNLSWTTCDVVPAWIWGRSSSNCRSAFCWGFTTAAIPIPRRCWSTPPTTP